VVPARAAHPVLRTTVERLSRAGMGSFLCVVKRMGPGDGAPMSFPAEGVTIAVDVPFRGGPLLSMLRQLDELVAREGGAYRHDRASTSFLDGMYPRRRVGALIDRIDPRRR
jgi:hypothetical protein